jgi:mannosyltransferase OCH1-like enzyme
MIPKKIHYCWFGRGQMPSLALKCIESWKKHLPEYELVLWNEDSFDVNSNLYTSQAYEKKKFAFITDYVRLFSLYNEGGIYMDTDVEVLKPLDRFLKHDAFSGFESINHVPTGLMAAQKGSKWAGDLLKYYENRSFILPDGSCDLTANTAIITESMIKSGLVLNNTYQEINNCVAFYPAEYFCPKDHDTGLMYITENTYCIHHFASSWIDPRIRFFSIVKKKLMKLMGRNFVKSIIKIFGLRQIREFLLR